MKLLDHLYSDENLNLLYSAQNNYIWKCREQISECLSILEQRRYNKIGMPFLLNYIKHYEESIMRDETLKNELDLQYKEAGNELLHQINIDTERVVEVQKITDAVSEKSIDLSSEDSNYEPIGKDEQN